MTSGQRLLALSAWLGFALAGLFFYPLAAAIDSDPYYLQWQPAHVTETELAILLLTVVFAPLIYVTWPRTTRWGSVALGLVGVKPGELPTEARPASEAAARPAAPGELRR